MQREREERQGGYSEETSGLLPCTREGEREEEEFKSKFSQTDMVCKLLTPSVRALWSATHSHLRNAYARAPSSARWQRGLIICGALPVRRCFPAQRFRKLHHTVAYFYAGWNAMARSTGSCVAPLRYAIGRGPAVARVFFFFFEFSAWRRPLGTSPRAGCASLSYRDLSRSLC